MRAYIGKVSGLSPAQITRLIRQQAEIGMVQARWVRNSDRAFEVRWRPALRAGGEAVFAPLQPADVADLPDEAHEVGEGALQSAGAALA